MAIQATQSKRQGKKRRIPWTGLAITLAAIFGVSLWLQRSSAPATVSVTSARVQELRASFTAEGFVRGKDYRLSPETAGRITRVLVREGDRVVKGQALLELSDDDASANLDQAKAAEVQAQSEVARAQVAWSAAKSQLTARIEAANAGVSQALANLAQVTKGPRQELVDQARQRLVGAQAARDEADKAHKRAEMLFEKGVIARATLEAAAARAIATEAAVGEAQSYLEMLAEGPTKEEALSAQAGVDAARAQVRLAKSGEAELNVLASAIRSAKASVARARAAEALARSQIEKLTIRSPVHGFVTRLYVEHGALASPLTAALTISTREDIHIEAEISSEDAAKVRPGMVVFVASPAHPGMTFPAKLQHLSEIGELKPDAAIRTRIVRAKVYLDEGFGRFRPGMEVDVEGSTVVKSALVVPSDALVLKAGESTVFVVKDAKVQLRRVKTGYSSMDYMEVVSGVAEGEEVVVSGKDELADGMVVRVAR